MSRVLMMAAVLLACSCPMESSAASRWMRLRSPHFVVVGDAGERELRQVAERVEGFREALRRALPQAIVATPVPTTIVVFGSDAAFTPFKPLVNGRPMQQIGGYFQAGEDANYIAISLEYGERAYPIIFHEYTHALLNATLRSLPVWLNEGLAEVYSTFAEGTGGRSALIGTAPPDRVRELRAGGLLPLDQIMTVANDSPIYTDARHRGMFYAQSWALTHYLLLGSPVRRAQLPRYLALLERGAPMPDAFQQAFECEPRVLEGELRAYMNQFTMNGVRIMFDESIKIRERLAAESIGQPEAQAYTAELLARQERTGDARARIDEALRAAPDLPRALAALGRLHIRAGRADDGLPLVERAASLAPDDAAIASTLARALVEQLRLRGSSAAGDGAGLSRARDALARAAALDPEDAYVIAMQGYVEYVDGARLDAARTFLERAIAQSPARDEYLLLLAQVRIEQGDLKGAQMLLGPLVARGSRPDIKEGARRALARTVPPPGSIIGGTPRADVAAADPVPAGDAPAPVAPPDAPRGGADAVPVNPTPVYDRTGRRYQLLLRAVESDATRVVGELESVDCGQGAIVLSVRIDGRLLRLRARGFDAVDFINYRDDPVAPPACGVMARPLRALATYRPAAPAAPPAADGEAVAVELVPDGYTPG